MPIEVARDTAGRTIVTIYDERGRVVETLGGDRRRTKTKKAAPAPKGKTRLGTAQGATARPRDD